MSKKTRATLAVLAAGALTLTMAPQAFAAKDDPDAGFGVTYNKAGFYRFAEKDAIATAVSASQAKTWGWERVVEAGKLYWECTIPNDIVGLGERSKYQGRTLTAKETYKAGEQKVVSYKVDKETRYFTCTATVAAAPKTFKGLDIIVARVDEFSDALAATPLADVLNAPVLLTQTGSLDPRTKNEIARLAAGRDNVNVHLLGGTNALSHDVENAIDGIKGVDGTLRYQGIDRFETAVNIAYVTLDYYRIFSKADSLNANVYLTTGRNFPDALAAGAVAAHNDGIVLLTEDRELDWRGFTDGFLRDLNDWVNDDGACAVKPGDAKVWEKRCWIDLNTNENIAIGAQAADAAKKYDIRLAKSFVGADRYQTAELAARGTFNQFNKDDAVDTKNYAVVSGEDYARAVAASAFIANADGPLLLTKPAALSEVTRQYLKDNVDWNDRVFTFGGDGGMQLSVHDEIKAIFNY